VSEPDLEPGPEREPGPRTVRGSRWVDYDTHELLEMIGELEDERRWARLREGIWIAPFVHLALLSAVTWIPKYVFKVPAVVDRNESIRTEGLHLLRFAAAKLLHPSPPKVKIKPVPQEKPPVIDKRRWRR
jgi:hypothetical protein